MPGQDLAMTTTRRTAGAGSLGRPRWVGRAEWQGGPVVREAKALLPSAWTRTHGGDTASVARCSEMASGRYRAVDPWYRAADGIVVRRLSPNNRKIEAEDDIQTLLAAPMLQVMGLELANVHLGVADARQAIKKDLQRRDAGWLAGNAGKMAALIRREQAEWASA
jgi:hypothetical protein